MSRKHRVRQGECLTIIAERYGFSWTRLWDDPENAALKASRGDPNVLMPGDVVVIPDQEAGLASCATAARHRFRRKGIPPSLRLVLTTMDGEPISNEAYVLEIDNRRFEGITDAEGGLIHVIPSDATRGFISLSALGLSWPIEIGYLDPIDTVEGVQQRLNNLGFPCGQVDGTLGEDTCSAIRAFKERHGLAGEELDDATRTKLKEVHGS